MSKVSNIRAMRAAAAALALGVGAMGMIGGGSDEAAASAGLRCAIQVSKSGDGVDLAGVVYGASGVSGEYTLKITKRGGGGSAAINQDGDFTTGSDGKAVLSLASLGGDGSFSAEFRVTSSAGSASCSKSGSL